MLNLYTLTEMSPVLRAQSPEQHRNEVKPLTPHLIIIWSSSKYVFILIVFCVFPGGTSSSRNGSSGSRVGASSSKSESSSSKNQNKTAATTKVSFCFWCSVSLAAVNVIMFKHYLSIFEYSAKWCVWSSKWMKWTKLTWKNCLASLERLSKLSCFLNW